MNTYLFLSKSIPQQEIDKRFDERDNWKKYIFDKQLDFLHIDSDISYKYRKLANKHVKLINKIELSSRNSLTSKQKMHLTIKENAPDIYNKYIPVQYNFSKPEEVEKHFDNKKIWIIKPDFGTLGEGIFLAKNYNDFKNKLKNKIALRPTSKGKIRKIEIKEKYVLSDFLDNPLLYNKYSFTVRLFVLIVKNKLYLINNSGWMSFPYKHFTTDNLDLEYHIANYNMIINNKIVERTERKLFPKYFEKEFGEEKTNIVLEQMYEVIRETFKLVKIKCNENQIHCYQIWSYDFGITEDYKVKLYEINGGSPDYSISTTTKESTSKYFLDTLFDNVIDVYFPPKNKVKKHPESYTIYLSPFFIKDTPNILNIIEKRNLILEQKWKIGNAEILKNYHFVFNHKFGSIKWDTIRQESRLVNYLQLSIPLVDKLSFYNIFSKNKKLLTYLPKTFINIKSIPKNIKYIISKDKLGTGGKGIIIKERKDIVFQKDHIYQEYIYNPLLIGGTKFDFRMYLLLNYDKKLYFYPHFLIRRARYPYTLKNLDPRIHLTNNHIQVKSNKPIGNIKSILTNKELIETDEKFFELYEKEYGNLKELKDTLYEQAIDITKLIFHTYKNQNFSYKNNNYKKDFDIGKGFQVFGIDLMFDDKLNLYLIEMNASPGLNDPGNKNINILNILNTELMENVFKLTIDPIINYDNKKENKFIEIIY